jgi:hypothetical protein
MRDFVPPYSGNIQLARRSRLSTEENVAMAKKEAKKLDELFHYTNLSARCVSINWDDSHK